jgi:hypothetical protein
MREETPSGAALDLAASNAERDFGSAVADRVLARGASVAAAENGAGQAALRGERAPAAPMS